MIKKKRTWKDCKDPEILTIFNEVKSETQKLYPQYFENCEYYLFIDSSTKHLGQCNYEWDKTTVSYNIAGRIIQDKLRCKSIVILLSKYITKENTIRSVLCHEFGHAVALNEHHSSLWLTRANKIGARWDIKQKGRFCNDEDDKEFKETIKKEGKREKYKYVVQCQCCGAKIKRCRKCSLIQYPWLWKCGECGGKLVRIANES